MNVNFLRSFVYQTEVGIFLIHSNIMLLCRYIIESFILAMGNVQFSSNLHIITFKLIIKIWLLAKGQC